MYCSQCGAELAPNASFCGWCGNRVCGGEMLPYTVIRFDANYAKEKHTLVGYGKVIGRGLAYCLAPLILMFFGGDFVFAAMVLSFCGIAVLIADTMLQRKYFLARQSAIVKDKKSGTVYYITMFGNTYGSNSLAGAAANMQNSAYQARLVQIDQALLHEVERYKAGENHFNIWFGGQVRVLELKDLSKVRTAKRYSVYRYMGPNGKSKKIKIPDCFPGMEEGL